MSEKVTEAGIVTNTIISLDMSDLPPAPPGYVKFTPKSETIVGYIRARNLDMVLVRPDEIMIMTANGKTKPKMHVHLVGMAGGQQLSHTIEEDPETFLAAVEHALSYDVDDSLAPGQVTTPKIEEDEG